MEKNIGGSAGILNMFVTNGDVIRDRGGVDISLWAAIRARCIHIYIPFYLTIDFIYDISLSQLQTKRMGGFINILVMYKRRTCWRE
jgi:hypothetical protein